MEGEEEEENRIFEHHNYFKPHSKIEILEERVFKTEPYFSEFPKLEVGESENLSGDPVTHFTAVRFCHRCNFGFFSVLDYLLHKYRVHGEVRERKKPCKCGRFLRPGLLKKHARKCPLTRLKCPKCGDKFSKMTDLIRHSCQQDSIEVGELDELQYDVIYVTRPSTPPPPPLPSQPPQMDCSLCGRSFNRPFLRATHEKSHRPRHLWSAQCAKCSKLFDRSVDLIWHEKFECAKILRRPSEDSRSMIFTCQLCSAQLSSLYNLRVHENIHTRKVTFDCDFEGCRKKFVSKQNLIQHRLTHSTERSFKCHLCSKNFKRAGGLRQHINSFHLNIKPHICPTCQHGYALKADMARCRHSKLKFVV